MAQLGRAPGLGPGGRRFESCLPDYNESCFLYGIKFYGGVAQLARASGSYPGVGGSILRRYFSGPLAQLVRAGGS